jgi:hypothetical protein
MNRWLLALLIFCVPGVYALSVGDQLKPLFIESSPASFNYKANGSTELILVYPVNLTSRKIGHFHRKVIAAGFCPKSIVDMSLRAWYAPMSLAEAELSKEMKNSPNPACTVTADYHQKASTVWGLNDSPVSIVTDGNGKVVFLAYGVLNEKQQVQVLDLLSKSNSVVASQ